jgi:hypothetical protein
LARQERSQKILLAYAVPLNEALPPLAGDEQVRLRSKEDIVRRAIAVLMTAIYAEITRDQDLEDARAVIKKTLETYAAEVFFTPEEKAFLESGKLKDRDVAKFIWRYECYWAALWALSFVDELDYPQNICDVGAMIRFLHESGSMAVFSEQAVLRSSGEILDQADLLYRYNWACADARANGLEAPAFLNHGVVMERFRMLGWIIRHKEQDWDELSAEV